jgi:poly(ADP-ribose) glycohydrolase
MIDFANKYIGGGALGSGTVQEEIMFFKHMEPLVALLFTEKLEDRESIFITGVQRFNRTSGFKNSFEFIEDFKENIFLNENFQNNSVISVIDALDFSNRTQEQFGLKMIIRELDKAFAGFFYEKKNEIESVATGRWGCGAFSGDDELKFVIQWLSASASKKKMTYLLWDFPCPEKAQQFLEELCGKASVAQVFRCLKMLNGRESVFKQVLKNFNKIYR